jgi:hypothetical protein
VSGEIFPVFPVPIEPALRVTDLSDPAVPVVKSEVLLNFYRPSKWTMNLMALFNIVRIKRAVLEWVPRCGASDRGNILVSHLRDVQDILGISDSFSGGDYTITGGSWTLAALEATGSRSTSFPIWQHQRVELPISNKEDFYSPNVDWGTVNTTGSANYTASTGIRNAFTSGVWMVGVEGLSQVANASPSNLLSDYGHFRISYQYELSNPISVGASAEIANTTSVVSSILPDIMSMRHLLRITADQTIDRSALHPEVSPFKRATFLGNVCRVGLDIQRAGTDVCLLTIEGGGLISSTGISLVPISGNAYELEVEDPRRSALFIEPGDMDTSITLIPVD